MTTKADQLGKSASFAAAAIPRSDRRRLIEDVTGDGNEELPRTARLEDLALNPFNPRHELTELQEMADSLLEQGQLQALAVVTREAFLGARPGCEEKLGQARFVVIDGNRRLGGAQLAGLDHMRIDVNDELASSATAVLEKALVANIQREDLSALEEAEALAALVEVHGSMRNVARRLSKSHVWVSQRLALLELTPELRAELDAGNLPVEDARQIGRLPQDEQVAAARHTSAKRQARKGARRTGGGNGVTTPRAEPAPPAGANADPAGSPDGAAPPDSALVEWEDLPSVASLLRRNLNLDQRRQLADLITAES